jgi:hypothetical protein
MPLLFLFSNLILLVVPKFLAWPKHPAAPHTSAQHDLPHRDTDFQVENLALHHNKQYLFSHAELLSRRQVLVQLHNRSMMRSRQRDVKEKGRPDLKSPFF